MKHILAAIDGSEASFRALAHAAELASLLNAELTILIVRLVIVGRRDVYAAVSKEDVEKIENQARDAALSAGATQVSVVVESSRDTAFKIVDFAIEKGADLIVMGTSGQGGFKAFLLGSVSQDVLKKSACPVTIVH